MTTQAAFLRGVRPLMDVLLSGREASVLAMQPDKELTTRIDELARKELTLQEREEYDGYVRADRFVGILRRYARQEGSG